MKIFPAVHYSMGGLWADYERTEAGGLVVGSPANHQTNVPNLYAIGECDYHYHGANRLGANSLLSCIFTGLFVGPGIEQKLQSESSDLGSEHSALYETAVKSHQQRHEELLNGSNGDENPYLLHQELGQVMTKAATVVRRNDQLTDAYDKISELHERALKCSLADTGSWSNQNVVFTKALIDMFPLAKCIVKGALQRDECRGAHYKPEFAFPALEATSEAAKVEEAEKWCDQFEANNRKWLKSTVADYNHDSMQPELSYEDVDNSLIPPRPRLYGVVGGEVIMNVWKKRTEKSRDDVTAKSQPVATT